MGVIIRVVKSIVTGIHQIVMMILPAVGIKRGLACHIAHRAYRGHIGTCRPVAAVLPVGIVSIHLSTVYIIELVGFEMMRGRKLLHFAVYTCHVGAEPHYYAVTGSYR